MVVSERRLMMYLPETSCASLALSTALTALVHTGSSGPERHAVLLREPWFRSCQHCCKRGRGLRQSPAHSVGVPTLEPDADGDLKKNLTAAGVLPTQSPPPC